jgi:hypothetical protein
MDATGKVEGGGCSSCQFISITPVDDIEGTIESDIETRDDCDDTTSNENIIPLDVNSASCAPSTNSNQSLSRDEYEDSAIGDSVGVKITTMDGDSASCAPSTNPNQSLSEKLLPNKLAFLPSGRPVDPSPPPVSITNDVNTYPNQSLSHQSFFLPSDSPINPPSPPVSIINDANASVVPTASAGNINVICSGVSDHDNTTPHSSRDDITPRSIHSSCIVEGTDIENKVDTKNTNPILSDSLDPPTCIMNLAKMEYFNMNNTTSSSDDSDSGDLKVCILAPTSKTDTATSPTEETRTRILSTMDMDMCSPISNPDANFGSENLIRYDDVSDPKIDQSLPCTVSQNATSTSPLEKDPTILSSLSSLTRLLTSSFIVPRSHATPPSPPPPSPHCDSPSPSSASVLSTSPTVKLSNTPLDKEDTISNQPSISSSKSLRSIYSIPPIPQIFVNIAATNSSDCSSSTSPVPQSRR